MIYVIENEESDIIAFSENLEYIYKYLKDYYHRDLPSLQDYHAIYDKDGNVIEFQFYKSGRQIRLTVVEIITESKCYDLYTNYDEFEIIPFYGDMVLTVWEYYECKRLLDEYYSRLYDYMKSLARKNLEKIFDKITDEDVYNYMKRTLGKKYYSLINQERFMMELGMDKIRELINGLGLSLDVYRMNMEYERKINDDK